MLEVTKKQVFTLLLENTFFEKPQQVAGGGERSRGGGEVVRLTPSCFRVRLPSNFGQSL